MKLEFQCVSRGVYQQRNGGNMAVSGMNYAPKGKAEAEEKAGGDQE